MSRALRLALAAVLAAASAAGVAALSQLAYTPPAAEEATLRLSWRARGERVQECRRLSAEEIAALPAHMRREEECTGRFLPSHLRVEVGGRVLVDDTVRASGARGDRPLYVFREIPLPPGTHDLRVRFAREGRGSAEATPALLELSRPLSLAPGEVALVTYDAELRALVLRTPAPAPVHPPRR
jgi:hypothetical protein